MGKYYEINLRNRPKKNKGKKGRYVCRDVLRDEAIRLSIRMRQNLVAGVKVHFRPGIIMQFGIRKRTKRLILNSA